MLVELSEEEIDTIEKVMKRTISMYSKVRVDASPLLNKAEMVLDKLYLLKQIDKEKQNSWNNLRQKYPEQEGSYHVKNMYEDITGVANFDGFNFFDIDWNLPLKGPLILPTMEITHWKYVIR